MINSLSLFNFESHRDTHVDFSNGVNVLVGESEQGKSAILRALYWVIFNRPSGEDFRSHWGGTTRVELCTDTVKVIREKGKGVNQYIIESLKDGSQTPFTGFGTNVPEPIAKALDLKPINIQTQFEGHFLLPPISSGEVAKQINQYVDLEIIDTSLANINSKVKEFDKSKSEKQGQLDLLSEEIVADYEHLDKAEKELATIETLEKRFENISNNLNILDNLVVTATKIDAELDNYGHIEDAEKGIQEVQKLSNQYKEEQQINNTFCNLLDQYDIIKNKLQRYSNVGSRKELIEELEILGTSYRTDGANLSLLRGLCNTIAENKGQIKKLAETIKINEEKIEKLLPKGSLCPTCGQEIK